MNGSVIDWDPFNGRGKVSGDDGDHPVSAGDCSSGLLAVLNNFAIPPDPPVHVTYDAAGTGEAINVDLAQTVAMAAAAPKAVVLVANKAKRKRLLRKKSAKASVKTPKKDVSKKRAGKKSRKRPGKSGLKRRRP